MRMRDLIDRAQALCVVRQAWAKGLNPARFIEAMPQGGWVSVKDRLPEADGPYIVMTLRSWEDMPFRVMIMDLVTERGQGRKARKWKWGHKVSMWRVTHWMELPEPPGEVGT